MTTSTLRVPAWSATALARLEDTAACPLCAATLTSHVCARCGADYREIGDELWEASQGAAAALRARQAVLERVPLRLPGMPSAVSAPATAAQPQRAPSAKAGAVAEPGSNATVQSVLAVAGAGLVAIAAIVFTFFNPDLTDAAARGAIVGAVTLVFLVGAAVLARRGLQFSAESVGALGLMFLGLDVHALTGGAPADPWAIAAPSTLVAAAGMIAWAVRARIRVWLWASLVALAAVPAMTGLAAAAPVLGYLGTAAAAAGLITVTTPLASRFGATLQGERISLTVVELLAIVLALTSGFLFGAVPWSEVWLVLCATLVGSAMIAVLSTRHPAAGMWSFLAGALGVTAFAALPWALAPGGDPGAWSVPALGLATASGAIVWVRLLPLPSSVRPGVLASGALTVVTAVTVPLVAYALLLLATTALFGRALESTDGAVSLVLGLAALSAGCIVFGALPVRRSGVGADGALTPAHARWVGLMGLWLGMLALLALVCVPGLVAGVPVAIGLSAGVAIAAVARFVPRLRDAPATLRAPLVTGAHALVGLAAVVSWHAGPALATTAGIAVVLTIALLATTVPSRFRFIHAGVGYAYALVLVATALWLSGVEGAALVCLVTSVGALIAIGATFLPAVSPRTWYAVLAVTSVPFLIGVGQVLIERSGWTALSTSLIFGLALTLVLTKRAGLSIPLRLAAAAILVPSLAVVVVCLGAQLLTASGSPVVLPLIAVIAACVLPGGPTIEAVLAARIGATDAPRVRIAIEASTLLTAGIAVALSLVREAAGLTTAFIVLVILGVGGAAAALRGGRRYGWALSAAAFTGALWCAWGIAGVTILEPYLLPPAIGAAVVAVWLTARGTPAVRMYTAGLGIALVPLVVLLGIDGPLLRAVGLVGASWALALLGAILARRSGDIGARVRPIATVTFALAIVAGAAGAIEGVRLGIGADAVDVAVPLVFPCLAFGLAGAVPAALAGRGLRAILPRDSRAATSRWLYAPAFGYVAVAAWPAIERDWAVIWTMWSLMAALLVALVLIARRGLRTRTAMPPVWFLFALAFVTAVVAWSPRDLRVEWFSLPLGCALLVAGVLGMRAARSQSSAGSQAAAPRVGDWPAGWAGSWALLAPGIVVTLSASVAATFTDPLTWRAILVIVLALAAILVGASRRLAAPFLIGIVVLPVENAIAFAVQIGRGIESMPWWITLAVVGAVLLIIAVTYERRAGEESGIAARLRDLA